MDASTLKERCIGFLLMCSMVPLAVVGYLIVCWFGLFGRTERIRNAVRALDHFVNASVFNGIAWESLSSHAWREQEKKWAKVVIAVTNMVQMDHARKANKREQPVVDLVLKKGLQKQTIK